MTKEILLNIMYTGTYLEDENANIGHEIINLFKADNGNNYIYILPYGSMSKKHNDKIKSILLVKRCSSKIIEIIAKATDLKQVAYIQEAFTKDERQSQHQFQLDYLDKNKITYGGLKQYKICEHNKGNDECIYVTFKANCIRKASKPIYITTDKSNFDCYFMEDVEHFPSQSPKMYIKEGTKGFDVLEGIINDDTLWEDKNTTPKVQEILNKRKNKNESANNFIDIIQKQNDELVFSNLFKYIFDANPSVFSKFAKEVLGIDNFSSNFCTLREKENIDLLLLSNDKAIVIENKIKSNINGICERHDIGSKLVQSQLADYHKYVEKNHSEKERYYFIFAPNYNHIKLENYKCGEYYKLIEFSKIYKFFEKNKSLYKKIPYFSEFLYALKKHIKSIDSSHEEIMHERFADAILKIKNAR